MIKLGHFVHTHTYRNFHLSFETRAFVTVERSESAWSPHWTSTYTHAYMHIYTDSCIWRGAQSSRKFLLGHFQRARDNKNRRCAVSRLAAKRLSAVITRCRYRNTYHVFIRILYVHICVCSPVYGAIFTGPFDGHSRHYLNANSIATRR